MPPYSRGTIQEVCGSGLNGCFFLFSRYVSIVAVFFPWILCGMSSSTRATKALEQAGVKFTVHHYDYDPGADRVGMQAAEALGEVPARVLKTLMTKVDGKPACVIVPSDREVSMKKLAAALGGKAAEMMPPMDAERLTGYKVGGISPFGQMKRVPVAVEAAALEHALVYLNGGQRGLQVRMNPREIVPLLGAVVASVVAGE